MLHKSETFDKFKEFHAEVERQLGKQIKTLRSDRGGEYLSDQFQAYLMEHGILTQLTHLELLNKMVWQKEETEPF